MTGTKKAAEPFFGGSKVVGANQMARHRRRHKEQSQTRQFDGMVRTDNWRNNYTKTNSLRSGKSLESQVQTLKCLN